MVRLLVAIVGSRVVVPVVIGLDDTVADLQTAIVTAPLYAGLPNRVDLYLARDHEGRWLHSSSHATKQLQAPVVCEFTQTTYLAEDRALHPPVLIGEYYTEEDTPYGYFVHVLARPERHLQLQWTHRPRSREDEDVHDVSMENDGADKMRGITWHFEPTPCPQLAIADDDTLVRIPWHYLANSGVQPFHHHHGSRQDLVLYRRGPLQEAWDEIERDCVASYARLWIVGGPGAGKSCAAFAFACGKVDRSRFSILWIHLDCERATLSCVKLDGDIKSTCIIAHTVDYAELTDLLLKSMTRRRSIVFLDGYSKAHEMAESTYNVCRLWQQANPKASRLVIVSSMVTRGKDHNLSKIRPLEPRVAGHDGNPMLSTMLFHLSSWTLPEYVAAVQHDTFFALVEPILRARQSHHATRNTLVEDKYYVAGGSARAMFSVAADTTAQELLAAVQCVPNLQELITGWATITSSSSLAVNCLLASYCKPFRVIPVCEIRIVSPLAARLIAIHFGPRLTLHCAWAISVDPGMDAHVFPEYVLACVASRGLSYQILHGRSLAGTRGHWCKQAVVAFDPLVDPMGVASMSGAWWLPTVRNRGGYDAVYMESCDRTRAHKTTEKEDTVQVNQRICFVQMTRVVANVAFQAEPFISLLHRLKTAKVVVRSVELFCVVPEQTKQRGLKRLVDEATFREQVVEVVYSDRSADIKCHVHVVGVAYPEQARRLR